MSTQKSKMSSSSDGKPHDVGVAGSDDPVDRGVVRLEVDSLATGGRGVARGADGVVWFLPGAVPGDVVEAVSRRKKRRFVAGRVLRRLVESPSRRRPPCEYQAHCGGCPWMVLEEDEQRRWKERLLRDALVRVGGIEQPDVKPLLAAPPDLGYRNRVELALEPGDGGSWLLGMRRPGEGRGVVDIARCLLQHDAANEVLGTIREFLSLIPAPEDPLGPGDELRVILRRSSTTGDLLVVLREARVRFPAARDLAAALDELHPEVRGVVRVRGLADRRGGARAKVLAGRGWIEERIGERTFRLPASTFVQVNSAGAGLLVNLVAEAAVDLEGGRVLDLYGGVGAYAFALLQRGAARVDVCDADGDAVDCGRESARESGERRVEFHRDDVTSFLRSRAEGERPALIVANPPRTGLGQGVATEILRLAPKRLVVVSCDPATLARDLRALGEGGYGLQQVTPVDLFPQTAHVEAVAVLSPTD